MLGNAEKSSLSFVGGEVTIHFANDFSLISQTKTPISYTFFLSRIRFPLKTGKAGVENCHFLRPKQADNAKNGADTNAYQLQFQNGPSDRIRTCGIVVPNHARYQLRYTRRLSEEACSVPPSIVSLRIIQHKRPGRKGNLLVCRGVPGLAPPCAFGMDVIQ